MVTTSGGAMTVIKSFYFPAVIVAGMLFMAEATVAAEKASLPATLNGRVNYSGMVVVPPCVITVAGESNIIEMETVRTNQFSGMGSWSAPQPFTIELDGCNSSVSDSVNIMFSGITNEKDPQVFQAGYGRNAVQGIGLGIFNAGDELMLPNTWPLAPRVAEKTATGTRSLHYFAKYRATSVNIEPGDASATVYFSAIYP
jgi:fimbrial protein